MTLFLPRLGRRRVLRLWVPVLGIVFLGIVFASVVAAQIAWALVNRARRSSSPRGQQRGQAYGRR